MGVLITITQKPDGFGTITGAGEHPVSTEVTLSAAAVDPTYPFLYFVDEGGTQHASPYIFTTPAEEGAKLAYTAVFDYLLRYWLQAQIHIELEEASLTSILIGRDLAPNVHFSDTTLKQQELCWADCIKVIITSWGELTEKMQGWTSTKKLTYRKSLIDMMNNIYAKYGEEVYGSVIVSRSNLW